MTTLKKHWWKILLAIVVIGIGAAAMIVFQPFAERFDETNPPQFIQADFIELDKIFSISKFRSGAGHDFSGNSGETCRSMKHYFNVQQSEALWRQMEAYSQTGTFPDPDPATAIKIFSPVDGKITAIESEQRPIGRQIWIKPSSQPQVTIRLFHIYPLPNVTKGMKVAAGEQIGTIGAYQNTDIAVQIGVGWNVRYYSYFSVMPDSVFAAYEERGVRDRNDFIISKEYRDAHPLECNGEQFAQNYDSLESDEHYIRLRGYKEAE
ncbi:MAG: hypothetical protein HYV34_04290 [Candidatus Kerfeldbacteria bacterium]|nr:hypothetical protein [Candidatus Kerfeldbacteria bacterium]